ncbi:HAD family hydrolase [Candidatus Pacearchaeota archaeon]|nr:HAD family hydrolase [Candidatus Pacearchaeota archaeon]
MNKCIFLDRDGVLVKEKGDVYQIEDIEVIDGVKETLFELKNKGYLLIVISNQPVIARGKASESEVDKLNEYINSELGGVIDKFYICPHHPEMFDDVPDFARKYRIKCDCRKPLPGMILKAALEFDIDLDKSFMIGDMITDVICGKNAGCKTIMVKSGDSDKVIKSHVRIDINTKADYVVDGIREVLEIIG